MSTVVEAVAIELAFQQVEVRGVDTKFGCACPGTEDGRGSKVKPCIRQATQEDGLCDGCRQAHSMTTPPREAGLKF